MKQPNLEPVQQELFSSRPLSAAIIYDNGIEEFNDDHALDVLPSAACAMARALAVALAWKHGFETCEFETSDDRDPDDDHFVRVGVGPFVREHRFDRDEWFEVYGTTRALVAYELLKLVQADIRNAESAG